jgi:hypothetical protein
MRKLRRPLGLAEFLYAFSGLTGKNTRQTASVGNSENFAIEASRKLRTTHRTGDSHRA